MEKRLPASPSQIVTHEGFPVCGGRSASAAIPRQEMDAIAVQNLQARVQRRLLVRTMNFYNYHLVPDGVIHHRRGL